MTEPSFVDALRFAMDTSSPRDSITRIKAAAIRGLEALDARARIHSTDYFNHSFTPDLVLQWPTGPQRERYVYLRLTNRADYLAEDVERTADHHPIIFDVAADTHLAEQSEAANRLSAVASRSQTLVTDAQAVTRLTEAKAAEPVVGLLSNALTQGGRGLVDRHQAEVVSDAVTRGFAGARDVGAQAVVDASRALTGVLDERLTGRMHRLLQAVWIGSGGRLDLFPAARDLSGDLDDESLAFLLELDEIADLGFWNRIGQGIAVSQLSRLRLSGDYSINLQHLVRANLNHLWARTCRVVDADEELGEAELPDLRWTIHRRAVALRARQFYAYLGERTEDVEHISGSATDGITVVEMSDRAGDVPIQSVQFTDGREEVDFTSLANENVMRSERLTAVAASLPVDAKVKRARAVLVGGKQLNCDFSSSTASAITRSTLSLPELLGGGLPLLRRLDEETLSSLATLLTPPFGQGVLSPEADSYDESLFSSEDQGSS